jgi:pimeloyl-ACP methyl ester carboxylesterase
MKKVISIIVLLLTIIACSEPESATFERFYFRTDNADLAIEINGNFESNTFIVLLHGGPGDGGLGYNMGTYSEILEENYAVVYLDQRGQGASKGNYKESTVTLQSFSDNIYNVTRLLKARYDTTINVFLLGHSWGGLTGTHSLINTPVQEEILGWIEADGAHDIPLLNIELIKMLNQIGSNEIAAGNNAEQWQEWIDYANSLDTTDINIDEGAELNEIAFEAESLIEDIIEGDVGVYKYSLAQDPDWSLAVLISNNKTADAIEAETESSTLTSQLNQIEVPTLLLWGKYDFVVPPALGASAAELIPNSKLVIFENSGHSPMDNEANGFAQAIIDFVEQNRVY